MADAPREDGLGTKLIHAGEPRPRLHGAASIPIFQCSVFEIGPGSDGYHDVRYPRLSNLPNQRALGAKLAAIEGAEAGIVTASGMAAISTTLLTLLGAGDHLLAQQGVYGGTHGLLETELPALGIGVSYLDGSRPETWEEALRPETRVIYTEALSNPLLEVADHRAAVRFAERHGLVSVIDNTFATPVSFRPLSIGYDLVLHSATKYLNGHSDLAAGAVVGSRALVERIKRRLDHLGGTLDPHACFLLTRGLKTLGLRVERQSASALRIAEHLAARAEVLRVYYPGLETHPSHERARELLAGYGGMLAFELAGGVEAAEAMIARLRLACHAPSLGGVETLITRPVTTSHAGMPRAERERIGITDALVRLSVGIEDADDLIADLDQALTGA